MNWLSLSALAICPNLLIKVLCSKNKQHLVAVTSWIWSFAVVAALGSWLCWHYGQLMTFWHSQIFSLITVVCLLSMIPWCFNAKDDATESHSLLLCICIGGFVTVSSGLESLYANSAPHWIQCYLGIEMQTIPISIMLANRWRQADSDIACAIKSFVMNTVASGFFLLGIAYCAVHNDTINDTLNHPVLLVGHVMIAVALLFKTTIMPFHLWIVDAYRTASYRLIAVLGVLPKISIFTYVLLITQKIPFISMSISLLGLFTLIFSTIAMVIQSEIKTFLAYSGIAHMAYLAIYMFTTRSSDFSNIEACMTVLKYLISYACAMIPLAIILLSRTHVNLKYISDLAGIAKKSPFIGIALSASFLSLSGLPPTMGFWAKLLLFKDIVNIKNVYNQGILSNILNNGGTILAIHMAVFSVIACYGYLRILKTMYVDSASKALNLKHFVYNNLAKICIALLSVCNAFFILSGMPK